MLIVVDSESLEANQGDSVATAIIRSGSQPGKGGTLCLAGDCGNCVAEVDGVAWVRTCQVAATPGLVVRRHPAQGHPSISPRPSAVEPTMRHRHVDIVVVGGGVSGTAEAARLRSLGRSVEVYDLADGNEVVAVYPGPVVVVRHGAAITQVHAEAVVIATGAAEVHPVCPGSNLHGILTVEAARKLHEAGVALGRVAVVGAGDRAAAGDAVALEMIPNSVRAPGMLVRFDAAVAASENQSQVHRVGRVVTVDTDGVTHTTECDVVVVALGLTSRDTLARMADDPAVTVVGDAGRFFPLPDAPSSGVVCPCSSVTVDDLDGVWDRGFREVELIKRSSLCGTGTCQGGACLPHLLAYAAKRSGGPVDRFRARPIARQLTLGEIGADFHTEPFKRTPLHEEHVRLGAVMDRWGGWWRPWHYGDHVAEYWAVRHGVSLGDVSTLGKMIVSGPDVVEALERLYPTTIADIKPGRSRYVLLLNERGHLIDDGMVLRETEDRFVLTFTSGGAANAEMWVRDWIESWNLRVHILDQTLSLAAINVTGPLAAELLRRAGVTDVPGFLQHRHSTVAGVRCHVMRLSFTGEVSFELHHGLGRSVELWQSLMALGADLGIKPHGLQALFGLRLEKGHVIVGIDTELDTTPRRVGMDWAVKMDKPDFIGRAALAHTAALPDRRRLVGLTMDGPAPVEGAAVWLDGEVSGHVSSSFFSPQFGRAVMLGWVKTLADSMQSTDLVGRIEVDGRAATVTNTPFYDPHGARARA